MSRSFIPSFLQTRDRPVVANTTSDRGDMSTHTLQRNSDNDSVKKLRNIFRKLDYGNIDDYIGDMPYAVQNALAEALQSTFRATLDKGKLSSDTCEDSISPVQQNADTDNKRHITNRPQNSQRMQQYGAPQSQNAMVLESKLRAAEANIRRLEASEHKLLESILNKVDNEDIYDNDLIQNFRSLRQKIQALAHNPLYITNDDPESSNDCDSGQVDPFYTQWRIATRKDRLLLARGKMFRLLHKNVLANNIFGISEAATANDNDNATLEEMNRSLMRFEKFLRQVKVPNDAIDDWRVSTLKCIRLGNFANHLGTELAKYMYDYFKPIMVKNADADELEKLRKQFLVLCQRAFKLRITMRRSLEGYASVMVGAGAEFVGYEDIAEAVGVFGGSDDDIGSKVDFTLFGALVKHPEYRGEGKVVLEKAQVVMERR